MLLQALGTAGSLHTGAALWGITYSGASEVPGLLEPIDDHTFSIHQKRGASRPRPLVLPFPNLENNLMEKKSKTSLTSLSALCDPGPKCSLDEVCKRTIVWSAAQGLQDAATREWSTW